VHKQRGTMLGRFAKIKSAQKWPRGGSLLGQTLMGWELWEVSGTYTAKIDLSEVPCIFYWSCLRFYLLISERFFLIPIKAFAYALLFNHILSGFQLSVNLKKFQLLNLFNLTLWKPPRKDIFQSNLFCLGCFDGNAGLLFNYLATNCCVYRPIADIVRLYYLLCRFIVAYTPNQMINPV